MLTSRRCSKTGCNKAAVATLTYSYADQQAVIGPLAEKHVPATYDLCAAHATNLNVPRGWEIVRLPMAQEPPVLADDLTALADAVREAAFRFEGDPVPTTHTDNPGIVEIAHRGHLTVIADAEQHRR